MTALGGSVGAEGLRGAMDTLVLLARHNPSANITEVNAAEDAVLAALGAALPAPVGERGQAEPIIRYAQLVDGSEEFDEFVAHNATIHFEAMGPASWWMQIDVGGRSWHINIGAHNQRVKSFAICEEIT